MVQPGEPIKSFEPLWGNWYADELLGEGGYGRVYRLVRRDNSGTYYSACKHIMIPKNESEIQNARAMGMDKQSTYTYFGDMASRILNEVNIMYALRGESNIVTYEDHYIAHTEGMLRWDVFIRMELLIPLSAYIADNPMEPEEVRRLGVEICNALEACEAYKIIHRDIKEGNIFLNPRGTFKLGDFGIARELMGGSMNMSMRGTPSYVAPEVYNGKPYDATVDVYSLGILMYKLLNGNRYPFFPPAPQTVSIEHSEQAFAMRMQGAVPSWPANGDDALRSAVMKVISFDPRQRFQSASEMKAALLSRSVVSVPTAASTPVFASVSPNTPRPVPQPQAYVPAQASYTPQPQPSYMPQPQATGAASPAYTPMQQGAAAHSQPEKSKPGIVLGIIVGAVLIIALLATLLSGNDFETSKKYQQALDFEATGSYEEALALFLELDGYRNSKTHLASIKFEIYNEAQEAYDSGDYSSAKDGFSQLSDYQRSRDYYALCEIHLNGVDVTDRHTLVALIGFEDASALLLSDIDIALDFLIGTWSCAEGELTFSKESLDYTLSAPDFGDTWGIEDGLIFFYNSSDPTQRENVYRLRVFSENEITCYAYNNCATYTLERMRP